MTKDAAKLSKSPASPAPGRWQLQDAKATFSQLVRMAQSEGPHYVTLLGQDAVVVIDAEEFRRLKGVRTGELLIEALQASPHREIEIQPTRSAVRVRTVKL